MSQVKKVATSEGGPAGEPRLRQVVGRVAHAIEHELTPGQLSELRRLTPEDPGGFAFWEMAATILEEQIPASVDARERSERQWAAVLCAMANTAGLLAHGGAAGEALARAGYPERRLDQLIRSSGLRLHDELRLASRFLASKGQAIDWTDLARLVLTDGTDGAESARRTIARSYFRTLHHLTKAT